MSPGENFGRISLLLTADGAGVYRGNLLTTRNDTIGSAEIDP